MYMYMYMYMYALRYSGNFVHIILVSRENFFIYFIFRLRSGSTRRGFQEKTLRGGSRRIEFV